MIVLRCEFDKDFNGFSICMGDSLKPIKYQSRLEIHGDEIIVTSGNSLLGIGKLTEEPIYIKLDKNYKLLGYIKFNSNYREHKLLWDEKNEIYLVI